ncbi:hypothetical protein K439DRAFT_1614045 [Ramaria rubella]|nr:hypothetical protein K439DRAFT_1614045 [Ramaria rubella]
MIPARYAVRSDYVNYFSLQLPLYYVGHAQPCFPHCSRLPLVSSTRHLRYQLICHAATPRYDIHLALLRRSYNNPSGNPSSGYVILAPYAAETHHVCVLTLQLQHPCNATLAVGSQLSNGQSHITLLWLTSGLNNNQGFYSALYIWMFRELIARPVPVSSPITCVSYGTLHLHARN